MDQNTGREPEPEEVAEALEMIGKGFTTWPPTTVHGPGTGHILPPDLKPGETREIRDEEGNLLFTLTPADPKATTQDRERRYAEAIWPDPMESTTGAMRAMRSEQAQRAMAVADAEIAAAREDQTGRDGMRIREEYLAKYGAMIDEARAAALRDAAEQYERGISIDSIPKWLRDLAHDAEATR